MGRCPVKSSRAQVSARSRPSPPLNPRYNRPSGHWPCVKSCLVYPVFCGYIKSDGLRNLVKIDGKLNSAKYIQFLKDNLISDLDDGEILQHDRDPCLRSRATQRGLVDKRITVLKDWSAQTPKLNIIEQLGTESKRRVYQKNPRNLGGSVGTQPQRMASLICEDTKGFVRIFSNAY